MNKMKYFFIMLLSFLFRGCVDGESEKIIDGNEHYQLVLRKEKEMVELAFQTKYYLVLKNLETQQSKKITGRYGTLPRVKRYLDMIRIENLDPAGGSLFNTHYVHPEEFTEDEFAFAVAAYRKHRDSVPELKSKVSTLVYGNQRHFHEVFVCPEKFFLVTDSWGQISITTDSSWEALTLPIEKRHCNVIGFFDDDGKLTLRTGRIVSAEITGLTGKPVKKIAFHYDEKKGPYEGEMESLWSDLLFNDRENGINGEFILSSRNGKGQRLDEVLVCLK